MKKNILLVEYDKATIETVEEIFPPPIFEVNIVGDGESAEALLALKSFDIMITAAMLPRFHGFNLSLSVANRYPGMKIVIISAVYKGLEYKHQAVTQYKANDFFEKPLDQARFRARVLDLLHVTEVEIFEAREESHSREPFPETQPETEMERLSLVIDLEEEEKKLTSEDIFADIIEKVEKIPVLTEPVKPEFGIDIGEPHPAAREEAIEFHPLFEDRPKGTVGPETEPGIAGGFEASDSRNDAPSPGKPERFRFKKDAQIEDILREELLGDPGDHLRPTEGKKKDTAEERIDLDLADMLLETKTSVSDTAMKKIEDDIAKKLEETLSGLGIGVKIPPAAGAGVGQEEKREKTTGRAEMTKEAGDAAAAVVPDSEFQTPGELGDYVILGLIARGGMAEIYKAKKKGPKGFEKIIAIKKILSGCIEDDKFSDMLVDEAKIAAELSHPNIVQIYDLGKKDDYYFIAMEYVLGKDLREIQKRLGDWKIGFPEELSLYLVIKVLEALNYAHGAKDSQGRSLDIVHRDVSPPNILISYNGDVKLADFGVSMASVKMHQTISGALKGKLLYMSPEQSRGEANIDYRSDLYSVGVILFELITGKKLFLDSTEMGVLKKVQNGEIIRPGDVVQGLDSEIERIILKSLEKEREKRYQSAAEMITDLEMVIIRKYPYIPGPVHLSHFIYNLFKDDITQEGVKVELKPIPEKSGTRTDARQKPEETKTSGPDPEKKRKTIEITFEEADPRLSEIRETGNVPATGKIGDQQMEALFSEIDKKEKHTLRMILLVLLAIVLAAAGIYFLAAHKKPPPVPPGAKITMISRPSGAGRGIRLTTSGIQMR
jgi:serine/threonine protein kinase/DNA-binding response OmpR family regulator